MDIMLTVSYSVEISKDEEFVWKLTEKRLQNIGNKKGYTELE